MIPYGRQSIDETDIDAVTAVLRSEFLTQGPVGPAFERAMASYCGAQNAVAVANATAALHLICLALGLGPGKRLWTSPITFVASANCGLYCGAEVDFVDIDPKTYNMCPKALAAKLMIAESEGKLPDVVIPVHLAGQSAAMEEIAMLKKRYGFAIVEDASHAVGAEYKRSKVGSCAYGDAVVFSFHPVKVMTTAEGGMVLTNDKALARRVDRLRSHGITRAVDELEQASPGGWYYEQQDLGFNYRLTDLQAALGLSQLARLDGFLSRRRQLAQQYDELLANMAVQRPWQSADGRSAFHLYPIWIDPAVTPGGRTGVFERLRKSGVGVQVHYIPVHLQPYFRALGFRGGDYPNAESYYSGAISLPMHVRLSDADQKDVVAKLRYALAGCNR